MKEKRSYLDDGSAYQQNSPKIEQILIQEIIDIEIETRNTSARLQSQSDDYISDPNFNKNLLQRIIDQKKIFLNVLQQQELSSRK